MSSTIWGDDVLISWGSGFWQPPTASLVKLLIGWSVERRRRGQLEYPAGVQTLSKFNKSPGHPLRASHLVSSFSFLFLFYDYYFFFQLTVGRQLLLNHTRIVGRPSRPNGSPYYTAPFQLAIYMFTLFRWSNSCYSLLNGALDEHAHSIWIIADNVPAPAMGQKFVSQLFRWRPINRQFKYFSKFPKTSVVLASIKIQKK